LSAIQIPAKDSRFSTVNDDAAADSPGAGEHRARTYFASIIAGLNRLLQSALTFFYLAARNCSPFS
jgi:hypothetical protein